MTKRPSLGEFYRKENARMANEKAERRQLVLAYPDLAQRLTKLPWPYADPKQWTGHIPPYTISGPGRDIRNDSPQRVYLVAIVHEAYARAYGEDVGKAWLDDINTVKNPTT